MALDSSAILVVGAANFFTAPYNPVTPTPRPEDLATISTPWENIGHTSLEDIFSPTSEGGEATALGSLQNRNLRNIYSPRTETFNIVLQQFDTAALKLFYGANAEVAANGDILVPETPIATVASFLAVFVDGDNHFAFYAPKAEILRGDNLSISDTESLSSLPLAVKPIIHGTNKWPFAVTPLGGSIGG